MNFTVGLIIGIFVGGLIGSLAVAFMAGSKSNEDK